MCPVTGSTLTWTAGSAPSRSCTGAIELRTLPLSVAATSAGTAGASGIEPAVPLVGFAPRQRERAGNRSRCAATLFRRGGFPECTGAARGLTSHGRR